MAENNPNLEVVAINDLGDVENMAYLLNYDTAQKSLIEMLGKKADFERGGSENFIAVGKNKIPFFSVKNPSELP